MTRIQVQAGTTLLQGFIKTPAVGLCEMVWNAFDEDATAVTVAAEYDDSGTLARLTVADTGNGMNLNTASREFARVGDSWKISPGTKSDGGRPVHGRHGRGRYSAFSIGSHVRWDSVATSFDDADQLQAIRIVGSRDDLEHFDITEETLVGDATGTIVTITGITAEAQRVFDRRDGLIARLTSEFALHLDRYPDFSIDFLGQRIDPAAVMQAKEELSLDAPPGVQGEISMTIIEWNLPSVDRRIYLCDSLGAVKDEVLAKIQAPGTQFTAFLKWDGFAEHTLIMELEGAGADRDDDAPPAERVIALARHALRKHLGELARKREAATVQRWKDEGIYPYREQPTSAVQRTTQDAFEVVAMAASRTVDESKSQRSKALALALLKETFESDPESLFPVLRQVTNLPAARIEELKDILRRTSLGQLIQSGHKIGNRIDFLHGLNEILFERQHKRRLLERRQLHRILAHETWIFGEQWSLTGDDQRLGEVLKKFLKHLGDHGNNVELESGDVADVLREDGSVAIPDLVLGRKLETSENHFSYLVIELKRPKHKLTDEDVLQLRSYASAITNDERFAQPNVSWTFILVGNETTTLVEEQRNQTNLPFGVVQQSAKYRLEVRQWAEILGDAEHRIKFVQDSLQYESDNDRGLEYLRNAYAAYLPEFTDEDTDDDGSAVITA